MLLRYINCRLNLVGKKLGDVEIANYSQGDSNEFDVLYVNATVTLKLNRALWIKDKTNMSNEQYRQFRKELNINSPSIYRLVRYQHELNRSLNIKRMSTGYYMDSMDLIKDKIEHLIKKHIIKILFLIEQYLLIKEANGFDSIYPAGSEIINPYTNKSCPISLKITFDCDPLIVWDDGDETEPGIAPDIVSFSTITDKSCEVS